MRRQAVGELLQFVARKDALDEREVTIGESML